MTNYKEIIDRNIKDYWDKFNNIIGLCFECCEAEKILDDIKNWHTQSLISFLEEENKRLKRNINKIENKCPKCGCILDIYWLPPICQKCFYSDDKDKWNGVKTKQTDDIFTLSYNQFINDQITHNKEIISYLKEL